MVRVPSTFAAFVVLSSCYSSLAAAKEQCVDEASCEAEAGSLLQLSRHQEKSLLSGKTKRSSACPEVGARAYLTQAALDYIMTQLFPFAYVNIEDGKVPVDDISGSESGFSYDFGNIQLKSIAAKAATVKFVEGRGISVHLSDIALTMTIDYKLASSSWWTSLFPTTKGVLTVAVGSGSFMSVVLGFGSSAGSPSISLEDIDVVLNIKKLTFDHPGIFDSFLNVLTSIFKPMIADFVEDAIKKGLAGTSFDVGAMIDEAINSLPLPFPLSNQTGPYPYDVDVRICGFSTGTDNVALDAYVLVNSTASNVYPGAAVALDSTGFKAVQSMMLGVGITEWTVNGFVWLFRRSSGMLGAGGASLIATAPLKLSAEPGTAEVAAGKKQVEDLVGQVQVRSSEEGMGFEVTDPSVRFFSGAVAGVANLVLDLHAMVDYFLGEDTATHTKFGDDAAQELTKADEA